MPTPNRIEEANTMVPVHLLEDVFSTGKTPEATYTPRTGDDPDGRSYDDRLRDKARRRNGGVMLHGVSKSGKTSLVERVLPEDTACWLQGTRIETINDFWSTLAQQLNISDRYSTEISADESRSKGLKLESGVRPVAMASVNAGNSKSRKSSNTWSFSGVPAQQVEDALSSNPIPIVVDDFHHIPTEVRTAIARAIKPLVRKTFVALIAIPSYSFDPAKAIADIGGRITSFKLPEWSEVELKAIAGRGFKQLNLLDPKEEVAQRLARCSFGSPHVMQELCYITLLSGMGIEETVNPSREISIPENFEIILRDAATGSEPFAFGAVLAGRNTKGEPRKPIHLKSGGNSDIYGIVMMAIRDRIPPLILNFSDIRTAVNELADEIVVKQRIVAALSGMSAKAEKNKGETDPIFSYRDETAYLEDPLFAFHLKYGDWQESKDGRNGS
ncbi:hypothetical protein [Nocardia colli]|uniref:hypothetical protein n=1 Tax=Nocardia colli TaxID=2545717 RepID=UPI0035D7EFD0